MKKKSLKIWKRIAAGMIAAVMVVGSVNLSDIVANAAGGPTNPYYDSDHHKYIYNGCNAISNPGDYYNGIYNADGTINSDPNDVFGAATHVHLFAKTSIESDVHTHGNIFCADATLGESGTRVQNNTLIDKVPGYREETYISNSIHRINGSSDFDTLILGSSIGLRLEDNGHRRAVRTVDGYYVKLDNTDPRYIFKTESDPAINFDQEFAYLEYLSATWAGKSSSAEVNDTAGKKTLDVSGWDGTKNLYYTISYADWCGTPITITGMDGTQANKGIFVINIDMAGAAGTDISLTGNGAVVSFKDGGTFTNKEYMTTEYGQCRIVYNIVNGTNPYEGDLEFGNTVFGSILAPKANITVNAVNGTVMANSIVHNGGESHRMDVWALSTTGGSTPPTKPNMNGDDEGHGLAKDDIANTFGPADNPNPINSGVNILIHKTYGGTLPNNLNVAETTFGLYSTIGDAQNDRNAIATAQAQRLGNDYAQVEFRYTNIPQLQYDNLSGHDRIDYYIKEISSSAGYEKDATIYVCSVTKSGDMSLMSLVYTYGTWENGNYVKQWDSYIPCNNQPTSSETNPDPTTPSTPDTPANPSNPTTPSTPDTPANPSNPTTPNTPGTPTNPSNPTTPNTPNTPGTTTSGTPDTPASWETPDGEVGFEILIEYEHIDSSSTPEKIDELITNTTIKIIDQNGNDVTENVTKITWDPSRDIAVVTVEVPKPSEGFDTYYVVESTDPADKDLSHSEPGKGFTVAITSDGEVLFQEDGSASTTSELRFVNVETATDNAGGTTSMTSMTSAQTGERRLPWVVFGSGMTMVFIAGVVYVFKKKEKIEE